MWYSSMKPGLCPAKRQSMERTNPTMAHAMGRSAVALIFAIVELSNTKVVLRCYAIISWWIVEVIDEGRV